MIRRLLILDAVLIVMLTAGVVVFRNQWRTFDANHDLSAIRSEVEALPKIDAPLSSLPAPSASDWTDIPAHNLFSFDRSDITLVSSTPIELPKPPGPKPFLFGTIFLGSEKMAMLAPAGNRSYRPVKVGEVIDGWTVTEIQDKRVVITGNGFREDVVLNDPTAQVARDVIRTQPVAAPPVNSVMPPSMTLPPSSSAPPNTAPGSPPKPKRTRVIETPLGPRTVEVPD